MPDDAAIARHIAGPAPVDPTVLTTEALQRESATLRELLELRIESESGARTSADETLMGAIELQATLRAEKLDSINRELELIERQRVEQKADTSLAVAAALQAAKEAVKEQTTASGLSIAKSENATNEQLKQLNATFSTAIVGVDRTINDLKDRVSKTEQSQAAQSGQQKGASATVGYVLAAIAALVAIGSLIIAFVAK